MEPILGGSGVNHKPDEITCNRKVTKRASPYVPTSGGGGTRELEVANHCKSKNSWNSKKTTGLPEALCRGKKSNLKGIAKKKKRGGPKKRKMPGIFIKNSREPCTSVGVAGSMRR